MRSNQNHLQKSSESYKSTRANQQQVALAADTQMYSHVSQPCSQHSIMPSFINHHDLALPLGRQSGAINIQQTTLVEL